MKTKYFFSLLLQIHNCRLLSNSPEEITGYMAKADASTEEAVVGVLAVQSLPGLCSGKTLSHKKKNTLIFLFALNSNDFSNLHFFIGCLLNPI